MFDEAKIKTAIASIIEAIGEDPKREGLVGTPERVAEMYAELFGGLGQNPREELKVGFELGHREMIVLRDIPFYYVRASPLTVLRCCPRRLYSQR